MSLVLPNVVAFLPYAYVIPEGNVRSHRVIVTVIHPAASVKLKSWISRRVRGGEVCTATANEKMRKLAVLTLCMTIMPDANFSEPRRRYSLQFTSSID